MFYQRSKLSSPLISDSLSIMQLLEYSIHYNSRNWAIKGGQESHLKPIQNNYYNPLVEGVPLLLLLYPHRIDAVQAVTAAKRTQ